MPNSSSPATRLLHARVGRDARHPFDDDATLKGHFKIERRSILHFWRDSVNDVAKSFRNNRVKRLRRIRSAGAENGNEPDSCSSADARAERRTGVEAGLKRAARDRGLVQSVTL